MVGSLRNPASPSARVLASLSLTLVLAACANSNFAGTSGKDKATKGGKDAGDGGDTDTGGPDGESTDQNSNGGKLGTNGPNGGPGSDAGGDSAGPGTGTDGSNAKDDGGGLLIGEDGLPCVNKLLPLRVAFAIDTTGSMDEELDAVKQNVVTFSQKIKEITPKGAKTPISDVKFAAVTYVDAPGDNHTYQFQDAAAFAGALNSEDTRGGINDHCEGGLNGARAALELLQTEMQGLKDGAIPVLIVISDNYSHDGKGAEGARSFDSGELQTAFKSKFFRNALLFDSTPTSSDVPKFTECPGAPFNVAPTDQWKQIRDAWKTAHPKAKTDPGRNVTFPFSATTITNDLPQELAKLVKICG